MPKFVLIDHSLHGPAGHHFNYALEVLTAAESAGHEIVLATARRFRGATLPASWRVLPTFGVDTYTPLSSYFADYYAHSAAGARRRWWERPTAWFKRLRLLGHAQRARRHAAQFGRSCRDLLTKLRLSAGDLVFFPTMTELDLDGLTRGLADSPLADQATWHLQFHFDVFRGREPEYAAQGNRLNAMRSQFLDSLARVPAERFRFYTPTRQLADQYNRLQVAHFEALPYPVAATYRPRPRLRQSSEPLRLTSAGYLRREKGRHAFAQLIQSLWPDWLDSGKIQLAVQCKPSHFRRMLSRPQFRTVRTNPNPMHSPVLRVAHPLDEKAYAEHIHSADIGLFLYDSLRYYGRCSGILLEMLSAGKPVIVPAGCWLAEQIAAENMRYLIELREKLTVIEQLPGRLTPAAHPAARQQLNIPIPSGASSVLIGFRWAASTPVGTYGRATLELRDTQTVRIDWREQIVGQRNSSAPVTMLFPLRHGAASIDLTVKNAYAARSIDLEELQVHFVQAAEPTDGCPAGQVGLTYVDCQEIPHLVAEISRHYAHYAAGAGELARRLAERHDARHTVSRLHRSSMT